VALQEFSMAKQIENSKGTRDKDAKLTFATLGYVVEQHSGKAEEAGDQTAIPTSEQKGGVKPTKQA
jgi:hypothetical protein